MEYTLISEGKTRLRVPESEKLLKSNEVFYNPHMEVSRDITVALVKTIKPDNYLDLLAASGARGIRILSETGIQTMLNDLNPKAVEKIRENLRLNNLEAEVTNLDAKSILAQDKYGFIDIDPFGPPVEFMDAAVSSVKNGGFIAATATDTSALSGTYPKACMRKYDAHPVRTDYYNELGLRILAGFMARTGLRHGYGINILFAHTTRHYMRVFARFTKRGKVVRETVKKTGLIKHCFNCLEREYTGWINPEPCICGSEPKIAGALYQGKTADETICEQVINELLEGQYNTRRQSTKIVELVKNEQTVDKPYYDIHKIAAKMKRSVPPTEEIFHHLKSKGFRVSHTHYNPTGIKTNATIKDMRGVFR